MRATFPAALCCVLTAGSLNAQAHVTGRGAWQLGGTARISSVQDRARNTRVFLLNINPRVGLFVTRGLAVSMNGLLGYASGSGASSWQYGIGPGITGYVGKGERLYPFVSFRTLATRSTNRFNVVTGQVVQNSSTQFTWLGSAGVLLMLARNVGLTGEFFYTRSSFGSTNILPSDADEYGVSLGVATFVF